MSAAARERDRLVAAILGEVGNGDPGRILEPLVALLDGDGRRELVLAFGRTCTERQLRGVLKDMLRVPDNTTLAKIARELAGESDDEEEDGDGEEADG